MNPQGRIEHACIRWHSRHGDPDRRLRRNGSRVDPDTNGFADCNPGTDRGERVQGGPEVVERGGPEHCHHAEATCAGTATVTFTATSAKFDIAITGCPATTAINIGHIHEGAAGVNGGVKIDSTLKAGELTLTGGAVTFSRTNSAADPALITAIMANPAGYYVNFHSTAHGSGVVRGQLTKG
ncbi:MAG: CHRD domain-containing protein [Chloroflexota bacterium]|nr:CHRD domain-containing protein [Chloroflexota bacterium]